MPMPKMTEPEIVSYLANTSLPTVLVEGTDDATIYRWMESKLGIFNANFLDCSGRDVLISIYEKRNTIKHGRLSWVADLDMWRYSAPPHELNGIIFTTGYSIENDLYDGSSIELLLEQNERATFEQILELVCRWFAFEIEEHQAGRPHLVSTHINQVVDLKKMEFNPEFLTFRSYSPPSQSLVESLAKDYRLSLRGKTLFQTAVHVLSHPKRHTKHSRTALLEMCLKLYPDNEHLARILNSVETQLRGGRGQGVFLNDGESKRIEKGTFLILDAVCAS